MARFDITAAFQAAAQPEPPAQRSIETVTGEILEAKRVGGEAILTIGRCLTEAKALLPHGEWLPWLNERVEFSERTARNFMRLAREWTNRQTLADLGASKALMLLALPQEEREDFVQEHGVIDMSARQLEAAIKERDAARRAAEASKAEARMAEQARAKMEADMAAVNAVLEGARAEQEAAGQELARLTRELEELRRRPVEVAVETVVDTQAVDRLQGEVERAREARDLAEARQRDAEAALEEARSRREAQAAPEGAVELAQFQLLLAQGQEAVSRMSGLLRKARDRADEAASQQMEQALHQLENCIARGVEARSNGR